MRKQLIIISTSLVFILTSCGSSQSVSTSNNTNISNNPSLNAVLWQQTAGEYDALCYQAFNAAKLYLERGNFARNQASDVGEPVIVMDLDETVIDNSAYNARLILDGKSFSENTWNQWVNEADAPLVPGAREFIQFAEENGFPIYYISNRSEEMISATIDNLQKHGINAEPNFILLKSESSQKAERRRRVLQENNIVMLIGDNLADFENQFEEPLALSERNETVKKMSPLFGAKFIVLPNPMYGDWLRTLENDDGKETRLSNEYNDKRKFLNPQR